MVQAGLLVSNISGSPLVCSLPFPMDTLGPGHLTLVGIIEVTEKSACEHVQMAVLTIPSPSLMLIPVRENI